MYMLTEIKKRDISKETRKAINEIEMILFRSRINYDDALDIVVAKDWSGRAEKQAGDLRTEREKRVDASRKEMAAQYTGAGVTGERFNSIQDARDAGHESGDTVMMWDSYSNKYRLGKIK